MAGTDTKLYDGSAFMRPFAIWATAYLFLANLLYLLTRGSFAYPDRWGDLYAVILGIYSGAVTGYEKMTHLGYEN